MKKRIILASIGLIIQIIQYLRNKAKYINLSNLIRIVNLLTNHTPTQLIRNFHKLQDYGLCSGKIYSSEKCTAILDPNKRIVFSQLYQFNNYRFKNQFQRFKKLIQTKRPSFITINDQISLIPIFETFNLQIPTTKSLHLSINNIKSSCYSFCINIINLIKNTNLPYVNDSRLVEHYLPEKQNVTILGKFKKQSDGRISCEKPIAIDLSKQKLIDNLKVQLQHLNYLKFILILGIGFCFGYILRQAYRNIKLHVTNFNSPIKKLKQIYVKSRVCTNCKEKLSTILLNKCGHMTLCKDCNQKLKICTQCKSNNILNMQIYAC